MSTNFQPYVQARHFFSPLKAHSPRRECARSSAGPIGRAPLSRSFGSGKLVVRFMPPKPTRSLAAQTSVGWRSGLEISSPKKWKNHPTLEVELLRCPMDMLWNVLIVPIQSPHQNIIVIDDPTKSRWSTFFLYPTEPPLIPTIVIPSYPLKNHHGIPSICLAMGDGPTTTGFKPFQSRRWETGSVSKAAPSRPAMRRMKCRRSSERPWTPRALEVWPRKTAGFWQFLVVFLMIYTRKIEVGKNVMIKREVEGDLELI